MEHGIIMGCLLLSFGFIFAGQIACFIDLRAFSPGSQMSDDRQYILSTPQAEFWRKF